MSGSTRAPNPRKLSAAKIREFNAAVAKDGDELVLNILQILRSDSTDFDEKVRAAQRLKAFVELKSGTQHQILEEHSELSLYAYERKLINALCKKHDLPLIEHGSDRASWSTVIDQLRELASSDAQTSGETIAEQLEPASVPDIEVAEKPRERVLGKGSPRAIGPRQERPAGKSANRRSRQAGQSDYPRERGRNRS
jgi:hypothetical protein